MARSWPSNWFNKLDLPAGPADDGRANAAPENLSFIGGAQRFVHERDAAFQPVQQLRPGVRRNVSSGRSVMRLDMREGVSRSSRIHYALREPARELFVSRAQDSSVRE
jgi:hypothetical protein